MDPAPLEQQRFASVLGWGTWIGFAVLTASALAYVFGLLPAFVPLAQMPDLWHLSVRAFVARTGMPTGWAWLAYLGHGEFASLAGIVILAGCSVVSLVAALAVYARRGDRIYAAICAITVVILLVAAAGTSIPGH